MKVYVHDMLEDINMEFIVAPDDSGCIHKKIELRKRGDEFTTGRGGGDIERDETEIRLGGR